MQVGTFAFVGSDDVYLALFRRHNLRSCKIYSRLKYFLEFEAQEGGQKTQNLPLLQQQSC